MFDATWKTPMAGASGCGRTPGAQLTLFETGDGWRYSPWVTNRPASAKGWLGQNAYTDAAHRVHARVEDAIRTGKDCGIGKYPSISLAMNKARQAAALTAAALLDWLRLLAPGGHLARAEPKTLRYRTPAIRDRHQVQDQRHYPRPVVLRRVHVQRAAVASRHYGATVSQDRGPTPDHRL